MVFHTLTRRASCLAFGLVLAVAGCKSTGSRVKVLNGSSSNTDFPSSVGVALNTLGIGAKGAVTCTGTFIRDDLLLTAGHCFSDSWTNAAVIYDYFTEGGPIFQQQVFPIARSLVFDDLFKSGLPASQTVYFPALYKANKLDSNYLWIDLAIVRFAKGTAAPSKVAKLAATAPKPGDSVSLVGYGLTDINDKRSAGVRTKGNNVVVADSVLPLIQDAANNSVTDPRLLTMIRLDGNTGGSTQSQGQSSVSAPGDSGGSLYNAAGEVVGSAEAAGEGVFPNAAYSSVFIDFNQPDVAAFINAALADKLTPEPLDSLRAPICKTNGGLGYGCRRTCGGDQCVHDAATLVDSSICRATKSGADPC